MRISFCHNCTEKYIAEFEIAEIPTKEQREAIEDEIYDAMDKWEEKNGDFEEFDFYQVCYDACEKHIKIIDNPVVTTIYI